MKVGDYFFLFSVEVVNPDGVLQKRLEFCDTIEKAGETAQKHDKKLKKNEEIWIVPYGIGQSKSDPPTLGGTNCDYFVTPANNRYTKAYFNEIKYMLRSTAPDSKYCTNHLKKPGYQPPYAKKNNNLSNYVFVAASEDNNYTITRKTKKQVEDTDIIVSYKRALCTHCMNNVKHCCCSKLPTIFTDIDENIQEAIVLLNRKGYFTSYCCEGHDWIHNQAYICFQAHFKFPLELPPYWFEEGNTIRLNYKEALEGNENFEEVKMRKMEEFLEWAKALPEWWE